MPAETMERRGVCQTSGGAPCFSSSSAVLLNIDVMGGEKDSRFFLGPNPLVPYFDMISETLLEQYRIRLQEEHVRETDVPDGVNLNG